MDKTLRQHIEGLQQRLQVLTTRLMDGDPGKLKARRDLQAELHAVESALALYHSAHELEARLSIGPKVGN